MYTCLKIFIPELIHIFLNDILDNIVYSNFNDTESDFSNFI